MDADEEADWLVKLYEEQGSSLHRLAVLLGAEDQSGRIVRTALIALHRRAKRIIDPVERVEFLQEQVVHLSLAVRPNNRVVELPEVEEPRQEEILVGLTQLSPRLAEIVIVSHYLATFGPELAGIMRLSLRVSNQRLEKGLDELRTAVGAPTPSNQPGVIESLSQEVTAALRASARKVQAPGTETLSAELRDLETQQGALIRPRIVAASCLAAALIGLSGAALTTPSAASNPIPSGAPKQTTETGNNQSLPALVSGVPLYYVGKQDAKLYRELRDLPATGDLLRNGLDNLFTLVPLDPDYDSAWSNGHVLGIELTGQQLTIDLTAQSYSEIKSPDQAKVAIDQMVYTASEITGIKQLKVFFRQDGGDPPKAFTSAEGFTRNGLLPLAVLWISSPRNASQIAAGQVTVVGSVNPSAEIPTVTVTNISTGKKVTSARAQAGPGITADGWRVWSVTFTLDPGNYDIRATAVYGDPNGEVSENKSVKVVG